jgi:hypothetical protein
VEERLHGLFKGPSRGMNLRGNIYIFGVIHRRSLGSEKNSFNIQVFGIVIIIDLLTRVISVKPRKLI